MNTLRGWYNRVVFPDVIRSSPDPAHERDHRRFAPRRSGPAAVTSTSSPTTTSWRRHPIQPGRSRTGWAASIPVPSATPSARS